MHKVRLARQGSHGLPKKTAVTILGRQPDSHVWALGPSLFIDELTGKVTYVQGYAIDVIYCALGSFIDPDQCPYVWLGNICDPILKVPSVHPHILTPLSTDLSPLINLCQALKVILGSNYMQGLGISAGVVMGLGYQEIIKGYAFCPSVMATGNLGRAKTTTLSAVMSTIGCERTGNIHIIIIVVILMYCF